MKMTRPEYTAYISTLPFTPSPTKKRVSGPILLGIRSSVSSNPTLLISPASGGKQDFDRNIDIKTTNTSRRRLITFTKENEKFRSMVNEALEGGESYPMLMAGLGFAMGFVTGGAGYLWTGATMALELSKEKQAIRIRSGDFIDQIEILSLNGFSVMHVELIVLVDPYRANDPHNSSRSQWVIHENRNEIKIDIY